MAEDKYTPLGMALNTGTSLLGMGLGLATAGWQDRRQIKQQQKLQNMSIEGSKEMGKYNQELALDTWEKTNYAAQRKQMEKAGLNIGLMYGGTGGGGTTSTPTGNVGMGNAPTGGGEVGMGIQLAMQTAMMKAQIENIQADTKLKETDAAKKGGIDTQSLEQTIVESKARIDKMAAETTNEKLKTGLLAYQNEMAKIQTEVAGKTMQDTINSINAASRKLIVEAGVSEATESTQIQQINNNNRLTIAQIAATKMNMQVSAKQLEVMSAQIQNMKTEQLQNWDKIGIQERELVVKQQLAEATKQGVEFQTSTAAQIRQWTSILTDMVHVTIKQ